MSTITLSKSDAAGVKTDVVVIGVVKLDGGVALPAGTESLNAAYGGKLVEVLSGLGATGKTGEVTKVPGPKPGKSALLIAVGLGAAPDGALKTEDLRTAAGVGVRAAKTAQSVAFALPTPDAECVRAVAEGALIGRYSFNAYKSEANDDVPGNLIVLTDLARNKDAKTALERAEIVADAVHQVRDWVNMPPSDLHPAEFAAHAVKLGKEHGVKVEVLDEKALAKGNYGGILGRIRQPAPADPAQLHPEEAGHPPRLRRQGHHLRLGRPVAEDRERHDQHEVRHGGCGGRDQRHPRDRAARSAGPGDHLRRDGGEHAVRLGGPPVRRTDHVRR